MHLCRMTVLCTSTGKFGLKLHSCIRLKTFHDASERRVNSMITMIQGFSDRKKQRNPT